MRFLKKQPPIIGGTLLLLYLLMSSCFGLDLEFDDDMLDCLPCSNYAHYDLWFNIQGNDLDGVVIRSGTQHITGGETLTFSAQNPRCGLVPCEIDEIICYEQVRGLYFDKAMGQRVRPMDPWTLDLLNNGHCGANYPGLVLTGGRYTDCVAIGDETSYINPYSIFGDIYWQWSGTDYHTYAGLEYNFDTNQLVSDHYRFVNNLQFIPQEPGNYDYYATGLQGIVFDNYAGIASAGNLMSCVFSGDGVTVPHGEYATGYHNNFVHSSPYVWTSTVLQCYNGEFLGATGFTYGGPTDCVFSGDGVTVPHDTMVSGFMHNDILGQDIAFDAVSLWCRDGAFSGDRSYTYSEPLDCYMEGDGTFVPHDTSLTGYQTNLTGFGVVLTGSTRYCWDGFLTGDTTYQYASYQNLPPDDCVISETDKIILHGEGFTGYHYFSVNHGDEALCTGQRRICQDGEISGTTGYIYSSCTVLEPHDCLTPWGQTVLNGESIIAYQYQDILSTQGNCADGMQTRTCNDGILSGGHQYQTCQEIPLDTTPDPVVFTGHQNLALNIVVTSDPVVITGMTAGYTGLVEIISSSGTILLNGVEQGQSAVVSNGDYLALRGRTSSEFYTTKYIEINIGENQAMYTFRTRKNTDTTFDDPLGPVALTKQQKIDIWRMYMDFLRGYEDLADICVVTQSIYKIIARELFETNKALIVVSNDAMKRRLYYKKLILEFLLETTKVYRSKIVHTRTTMSAGEPVEYEVVGCKW